MSFTSIPSGQILAGQPLTQDLCTEIKNDLDDLNSRLSTVETGIVLPPLTFDVIGALPAPQVISDLMIVRIANNVNLLAARLLVDVAGSGGTLTIDLQYKRGAGAWTSILSSPISAASSSGNNFLVSGTLAITALQTGDLVRLHVTAIQTAQNSFSAILEMQGS